ncbi:hypothetical protein QCE49_12565 [Caballeronia sp. LZ008]|uniref:hypothetical protein n=1 Tax=unclassified Caballeronia TaxID=2646786 RepID=UPI0020290679|nr:MULTISPECIES: hypothetical protein [unclassified Caballeronia]MDR5794205.1 hypothetical protein [Caballeronia sp. LZ008]
MLIVTIEKLPHGATDDRRVLGEARIINIGGDAGFGAYSVDVLDYAGNIIARGELTDHPQFASSTVWGLTIRALAVALSGSEKVASRRLYPRNQ